MKLKQILLGVFSMLSIGLSGTASAGICQDVSYDEFKAAVNQAYDDTSQFGFGTGMWATLVNQSGKVCHVYSVAGSTATENNGFTVGNKAWLGSRVISVQKANTANAFSLNDLAVSTGALSAAVYPGGSLYGLQHSNPVDATIAYKGDTRTFGTVDDPLVNSRIGGINVFGGGVALYRGNGFKAGAVGVSGDTSCRDHAMAYRLRANLGLDNFPNDDALALVDSPSALFEQPACGTNDPTGESFGIASQ